MLNPERLRALERWQSANGITLAQTNGQRKYGGPPDGWEGPAPGEGCEVFISKVPRETYEDLLIPLFSGVGPLWEFRLMMNFSGQNRGFAYAKYCSRALAAVAVGRLHGHELEPGIRLNVCHSTEKRKLCVSELPADTEWAQLMQVLMNLTEGVVGLSLMSGPDITGVSALVVYVSHYAASMAKKVLGEGFKKLFSLRVFVNWQPFHPEAKQTPPRLPPRLRQRQRRSPASTFDRAPGGALYLPPARPHSPPPAAKPLVQEQKAPCAWSTLCWLCAVLGGSEPTMGLEFSHTDPGGLLHYVYKVRLPGMAQHPQGMVATTPGASMAQTLQWVHQLAAEQVLLAVQPLTR